MQSVRATVSESLEGATRERLEHFEEANGAFLMPLLTVAGFWARMQSPGTVGFVVQLSLCALRELNKQTAPGYRNFGTAVHAETGIEQLGLPLCSFLTGCIARGNAAQHGGGYTGASKGCHAPGVAAMRIACALIGAFCRALTAAAAGRLPYYGLAIGNSLLGARDVAVLVAALPPLEGPGAEGCCQCTHCSRLRDPRMSPKGHTACAMLALVQTAAALRADPQELWVRVFAHLEGADRLNFLERIPDDYWAAALAARDAGDLEAFVNEAKRGSGQFASHHFVRSLPASQRTPEQATVLEDHVARAEQRCRLGGELALTVISGGVARGGLFAAACLLLPRDGKQRARDPYQVANKAIRGAFRGWHNEGVGLVDAMQRLYALVGEGGDVEGGDDDEDDEDGDEEGDEDDEDEEPPAPLSHAEAVRAARGRRARDAVFDVRGGVAALAGPATRSAKQSLAAFNVTLGELGKRPSVLADAPAAAAWDAAVVTAVAVASEAERLGCAALKAAYRLRQATASAKYAAKKAAAALASAAAARAVIAAARASMAAAEGVDADRALKAASRADEVAGASVSSADRGWAGSATHSLAETAPPHLCAPTPPPHRRPGQGPPHLRRAHCR